MRDLKQLDDDSGTAREIPHGYGDRAVDPRPSVRSENAWFHRPLAQAHGHSFGFVAERFGRVANELQATVTVTSGDRDYVPKGGSKTSLHLAHRAADFSGSNYTLASAFFKIKEKQDKIFDWDKKYEVIHHGVSPVGWRIFASFTRVVLAPAGEREVRMRRAVEQPPQGMLDLPMAQT